MKNLGWTMENKDWTIENKDWKLPGYTPGKSLDMEGFAQNYEWVNDMKGVPQDKEHHAEGDVFIHTSLVIQELTKLKEFRSLPEQDQHILVTSALMHDIEKRSTTREEVIDGRTRITSPSHAKKGEFTSRALLYSEFNTPHHIREQIAKLVRHHGIPLWFLFRQNPVKEIIKTSLVVRCDLLMILAKADILGRTCGDSEEMLLRIDLFKEMCTEHNCFNQPFKFETNSARHTYLNKKDTPLDYVPYEEESFTVHMMCALPGTGKDTFIQNNYSELPMVSLDEIRREHNVDPADSSKSGFVVQQGLEQAKILLRKKQSFVYNATNINRDMRKRWLQLFNDYGARIKIIYLEVPYSKMIQQNKDREYVVPGSVIHDMMRKFEMPGFDEAHDIEYHIRD